MLTPWFGGDQRPDFEGVLAVVTDRGLEVLRALILDYVETSEPVGSKRLVERYQFGVSAATIRNDMALLEEAELIHAPHTSSGRVPTDKGYRVFVDQLVDVRPLTAAQRRAIETFMIGSADPEQLLERSVRKLAQLTGSVAIGHLPSLHAARVQQVELVSLPPHRILVVIVTNTGRVQQEVLESTSQLPEAEIERLRDILNEHTVGKRLESALDTLAALRDDESLSPLSREIVGTLIQQLLSNRDDRLVIAGAANLARRERDFSSIFPVLEAIEEQVALIRLIAEFDSETDEVAISIGHENSNESLEETSIVTSRFRSASGRAHVGVLGPTRMDYQRNIGAVRAVARYLGRFTHYNTY